MSKSYNDKISRLNNVIRRGLGTAVALLATAVPLHITAQPAHLYVDGKPMKILGGELSNSAATCTEDIDRVMPEMRRLGLNTVLVPAQWDLIEPKEGRFDFTLIGHTIDKARENGLKVVFLWFGAWKNSMSCYAPLWFKADTHRFPRAMTAEGKPLEIASAFSDNVLDADNRAFTRLMEYIREKDADSATVIMVQIENEIGMLEDARDHSPEADREFNGKVPDRLLDRLADNAAKLHPVLLKKLTGSEEATADAVKTLKSKLKKGGTWSEVFGNDIYTDEIFMAYHYAAYVEHLAQSARRTLDIPLYVNAAMNSRGRKPGEYPSAGPLAHLKDIWHCGAPSIDILSPDIYDTGFKGWAEQYALADNPLFIPESKCCENSGVRAMYAFGEHGAVGFCPFAIDEAGAADKASISGSYAMLNSMMPLLTGLEKSRKTAAADGKVSLVTAQKADRKMWGLLFDKSDNGRVITDGDVVMTCNHYFTLPWDARAKAETWTEGGGIIIKLGTLDYIVAGNGIVVTFKTASEKAQEESRTLGEDGFATAGADGKDSRKQTKFTGRRIGIGYVDEVSIGEQGEMTYLRRHNGDQTHQGRHTRISVGENKILHVRLYEY